MCVFHDSVARADDVLLGNHLKAIVPTGSAIGQVSWFLRDDRLKSPDCLPNRSDKLDAHFVLFL